MTQKQNSMPERPIAEEPQGELGQGHKAWAPDQEEQGISNRPDDVRVVPESDEAEDAAAFANDEDDDDVDEDEENEEDEEETDE